MPDQLTKTQERLAKTLEHLKGELRGMRSGRVTPALVEQVRVEAYSTVTPLVELASITAPEPRLLVVSPWDPSILKEVERALQGANLGATPTVDSNVVRLNFPPLTEERRREQVKLLGAKLEESRVAIRSAREEALRALKQDKSAGALSEDDFFMAQKELQKLVDEHNEKVKALGAEKEQEILTI